MWFTLPKYLGMHMYVRRGERREGHDLMRYMKEGAAGGRELGCMCVCFGDCVCVYIPYTLRLPKGCF